MDAANARLISHVSAVSRVKEAMGVANVSLITHEASSYDYPIICDT
jgi:hypothetical protein